MTSAEELGIFVYPFVKVNLIFTKALLEGLKGAAVDQDGNITLDALELYIREQVRKATGGRQMPIFENRQGNYILFEKK